MSQTGTQEWFSIKKGLHQPMTKVKAALLLRFDVSLHMTACVFPSHSFTGAVRDRGRSLQVYRRGPGRHQTQQGRLESGVHQV